MSAQKLISKKVIIIEDDPISAATLVALLQDLDFSNTSIVSSGKEAIELFSENIDLIFMDLNLPDTDGFKLTHYYRKIFPKKDTPIICWSTASDSKRRECIESGMNDFLSKPVTQEKLQEILECWLPAYRNPILNPPEPVLNLKE
jgi:two-component system sensor histidine kinase/response regulator